MNMQLNSQLDRSFIVSSVNDKNDVIKYQPYWDKMI